MSDTTDNRAAPRFVFCHKQKTSARLHFLRFEHGVLAFSPLPHGAQVHSGYTNSMVRAHPVAWTCHVETALGLKPHSLCSEPDFHVEARAGEVDPISILLACFTSIDLPKDAAQRLGARWVLITETKDIPTVELEVVHLVYEHLIG